MNSQVHRRNFSRIFLVRIFTMKKYHYNNILHIQHIIVRIYYMLYERFNNVLDFESLQRKIFLANR